MNNVTGNVIIASKSCWTKSVKSSTFHSTSGNPKKRSANLGETIWCAIKVVLPKLTQYYKTMKNRPIRACQGALNRVLAPLFLTPT